MVEDVGIRGNKPAEDAPIDVRKEPAETDAKFANGSEVLVIVLGLEVVLGIEGDLKPTH